MDLVPHRFFDRVTIVNEFNIDCETFQIIEVGDFLFGWLYSSNIYIVNITKRTSKYLTNSDGINNIFVRPNKIMVLSREDKNRWDIFNFEGEYITKYDPRIPAIIDPNNAPHNENRLCL